MPQFDMNVVKRSITSDPEQPAAGYCTLTTSWSSFAAGLNRVFDWMTTTEDRDFAVEHDPEELEKVIRDFESRATPRSIYYGNVIEDDTNGICRWRFAMIPDITKSVYANQSFVGLASVAVSGFPDDATSIYREFNIRIEKRKVQEYEDVS